MTNGNFKELAAQNQFTFIQIGTKKDYLQTVQSVNVHQSMLLGSKLLEFLVLSPIQEMIQRMKDIPSNDLLIVSYPANIGVKAYAEKYRIPFVSVVFAPILLQSTLHPARIFSFDLLPKLPQTILQFIYFFIHKLIDLILLKKINLIRSNLNLNPIKTSYSWLLSQDLILGLFHEKFSLYPLDWPKQLKLTGFPLACIQSSNQNSDLKDFLLTHKKTLLFTQGTPNAHVYHFFKTVKEVCVSLNISAIFVCQFHDQLLDLTSDSIFICKSVNLSEVLPQISGVVHHGGVGTSAQSLKAGIPQIVVPWGVDQFDNSKHLKRMGVAIEIHHGFQFKKRLTKAILQLLKNKQFKEQAHFYAQQSKMYQGAKKSYDTLTGFFKQFKSN